ncbi:MAG: thioredoxin family protein [Burkholderiaceae bacterium]|nr:thioredoxin family protein [Burkholderiaceae bacterium]
MRFLSALSLSLSLVVAAPVAAQSLPRFGAPEKHVDAELIAATDAIVPGKPITVGLRLKHEHEWHTYWQVPGDSGLPTQMKWQLPAGFNAGPIEWPHPKRLPVGPLMNFGYEGETLLLTTVQVPADLPLGTPVTLSAKASWLECKDVCIPGDAQVKLTLPVKSDAAPSASASLFKSTLAQVPQSTLAAQATIDASRIRVAFSPPADKTVDKVEFFPLEESRIEPAAPQELRKEGAQFAIYLTAAKPVGADFKTLNGVVVANGGPANASGWSQIVQAPLAVGTIAGAAGAAVSGENASSMSLLAALATALLGGLILNLMPCVFPVLSLKLIGLAQHRTHTGPMAAHGIAFAVGVVLSFVLLAALLIGLQQAGTALGWGFQLQTPWVVAALTVLFFGIGLNLLGVYEFTMATGVANLKAADALAHKSDWRGSFGTGVLAVIVASPCTAPFMGAALGYAITQPAVIALTVFAALGVGMALPYVLLTLFPSWLAKLPRPGRWMELFKQFMAFPMFATCVWLLWVLAQQVDAGGIALALGVLVAVGFTLWALGLSQRGARMFRWVAAVGGMFAALTFAPIATSEALAPGTRNTADAGWIEYSAEKLAQLHTEGKPVFVDFTAAWCVTCQVNKRVALRAADVKARFASDNVVLMRADWTNRDERITHALAQFGRNGVPLYVLYDRKGVAEVLPELLTQGTVLAALDKLRLKEASR